MERHLSVTEAARTLGVHPQTVYSLIWGGRLPGVIRVGRAIRIPESALDLFPGYAPPKGSAQVKTGKAGDLMKDAAEVAGEAIA